MKFLCDADHNCLSRLIGHIDFSIKSWAYQREVSSNMPEVKKACLNLLGPSLIQQNITWNFCVFDHNCLSRSIGHIAVCMKLRAYHQQKVSSDVPEVKQSLFLIGWGYPWSSTIWRCLLNKHDYNKPVNLCTKSWAYQQTVGSDVPEVKQSLSRSARAIFDPAQFDTKFLCLWLIIIAFRGRLATPWSISQQYSVTRCWS